MRCIMRRSFTVLSTARTAGIRPTRRSRELNHNLVVATSAKEVFEELAVCAAQKQRPTLVNLSTALTTLARFDKVGKHCVDSSSLELLLDEATRQIATAPSTDPAGGYSTQTLANCAHAAAQFTRGRTRSNVTPNCNSLLIAIDKAVATMASTSFQPREITNIACAMARTESPTSGVMGLLNDLCKSKRGALAEFTGRDISSLVWACAKTKNEAPVRYFRQAAGEVVRRKGIGFESPASLVNTAWGFASMGFFDPELFSTLGMVVKTRKLPFHPDRAQSVTTSVCREITQLGDFNAHAISRLSWSFAAASCLDAPLASIIVSQAEAIGGKSAFTDTELRNFLWAISTVDKNSLTSVYATVKGSTASPNRGISRWVREIKLALENADSINPAVEPPSARALSAQGYRKNPAGSRVIRTQDRKGGVGPRERKAGRRYREAHLKQTLDELLSAKGMPSAKVDVVGSPCAGGHIRYISRVKIDGEGERRGAVTLAQVSGAKKRSIARKQAIMQAIKSIKP